MFHAPFFIHLLLLSIVTYIAKNSSDKVSKESTQKSLIYKFITIPHSDEKFGTIKMRRAISDFIWDKAFSNINVNEKVYIFSYIVLNILLDLISHESIIAMTCFYHDSISR